MVKNALHLTERCSRDSGISKGSADREGCPRLELHIPQFDELGYRQRIMADPATMDYNRGFALHCAGYDSKTGCIAFPRDEWRGWYDYFVGGGPDRFYAYIKRAFDGEFLGEVNLHRAQGAAFYEMGIVVEGKHRGRGYSGEALRLLLERAFFDLDAREVRNSFSASRTAALRVHTEAGFEVLRRDGDDVFLRLTRESFLRAVRSE